MEKGPTPRMPESVVAVQAASLSPSRPLPGNALRLRMALLLEAQAFTTYLGLAALAYDWLRYRRGRPQFRQQTMQPRVKSEPVFRRSTKADQAAAARQRAESLAAIIARRKEEEDRQGPLLPLPLLRPRRAQRSAPSLTLASLPTPKPA